jgi:hypothetical protein
MSWILSANEMNLSCNSLGELLKNLILLKN